MPLAGTCVAGFSSHVSRWEFIQGWERPSGFWSAISRDFLSLSRGHAKVCPLTCVAEWIPAVMLPVPLWAIAVAPETLGRTRIWKIMFERLTSTSASCQLYDLREVATAF